MRKLAAFILLTGILTTTAGASQVTTADLSGHKICWSSGVTSTYKADGTYASGKLPCGIGTWAISTG